MLLIVVVVPAAIELVAAEVATVFVLEALEIARASAVVVVVVVVGVSVITVIWASATVVGVYVVVVVVVAAANEIVAAEVATVIVLGALEIASFSTSCSSSWCFCCNSNRGINNYCCYL